MRVNSLSRRLPSPLAPRSGRLTRGGRPTHTLRAGLTLFGMDTHEISLAFYIDTHKLNLPYSLYRLR